MSTKVDGALDPHQERAVAVAAKVDPRTVRRFLAGGRQAGPVRDAVKAALVDLGHGALVPQPRDGETPQPEAKR